MLFLLLLTSMIGEALEHCTAEPDVLILGADLSPKKRQNEHCLWVDWLGRWDRTPLSLFIALSFAEIDPSCMWLVRV